MSHPPPFGFEFQDPNEGFLCFFLMFLIINLHNQEQREIRCYFFYVINFSCSVVYPLLPPPSHPLFLGKFLLGLGSLSMGRMTFSFQTPNLIQTKSFILCFLYPARVQDFVQWPHVIGHSEGHTLGWLGAKSCPRFFSNITVDSPFPSTLKTLH